MRLFLLLIPFLLLAEIFKFDNLKPFYYQHQIVKLNGKIIFPKETNLTVIPPNDVEVNLTKINPFIYNFSIKFQANDLNKTIIFVGNNYYKELNLTQIIKTKPLYNPPQNFCNVFAKSFKIINPISSKYDKNKNILSFTIKCKQCNLKDFNLSEYETNLTLKTSNEATLYLLLNKNIKKFTFYYFDLKSENFKKITIPIKLKEETISTQTQINPENQTFFTPVHILILFVIAFFLIVFLVYQRVFILIIPILLGGYLIYQLLPKGEIMLPKNTKVQILPTPQSTVIYVTKQPQSAKILLKRDHYIKIEIDNKVGWVKNDF